MLDRFRYWLLNYRLKKAVNAIPLNAPWGVEILIQRVEEANGRMTKTRTLKSWQHHDTLSQTKGTKQIDKVSQILSIPWNRGYRAFQKGKALSDNPFPNDSIEFYEFESGYNCGRTDMT
ncbi:hypothetical protein L1D14_07600 [Vibrio tubiashii]|uniref:hypothetical protein n=1 Tax=Vibrio tubiashii TaxID=29498 RepID=UPI001EFD09DA|nr:hypothetical protein [Vibrio tubiashii]MCG9576103.1 hypothetical protein [Vibrio tubiashii]